MTPETLVTELRAAGVRLTIENGKIKAAGSKAALARWLPVLRECKADLLGYLYLWVGTLREVVCRIVCKNVSRWKRAGGHGKG
jgi:hypothetical protein